MPQHTKSLTRGTGSADTQSTGYMSNSRQIREVADWSSSLRVDTVSAARADQTGVGVTFEVDATEVAIETPGPLQGDEQDGTQCVGPMQTVALTHRPHPREVVVRFDDGTEDVYAVQGDVPGITLIDALFLSEAAVEKFVFPYYASKDEWRAAHSLGTIATEFYGFVPEAENPVETRQLDTAEDSVPYGMIHIPRSEYEMAVMTPDGGLALPEPVPGPGNELIFLTRDGRGALRLKSLAQALQERSTGRGPR